MKKRRFWYILGDMIGLIAAFIVFIIPFIFMLVNSLKERKDANLLSISWPKALRWENFVEVFQANNYQIVTAFKNSFILVIGSVIILIITGSMCGYIIQRRNDKVTGIVNALIMTGLMVPAAILPTIWVLQRIHLYKTITGMILIEVALNLPFTIMLYRGFMNSIPLELEEAGYIDGCSRWKLYSSIIFPLLKPVT